MMTGKKDSESDTGRKPHLPDEKWELCGYCGGTGKDYDGRLVKPSERICPNCDGLGVVYD